MPSAAAMWRGPVEFDTNRLGATDHRRQFPDGTLSCKIHRRGSRPADDLLDAGSLGCRSGNQDLGITATLQQEPELGKMSEPATPVPTLRSRDG